MKRECVLHRAIPRTRLLRLAAMLRGNEPEWLDGRHPVYDVAMKLNDWGHLDERSDRR